MPALVVAQREVALLDALGRIDALAAGVTRDDIQKMPPAHRQRLAQALRHVADLCDPPAKAAEPPKPQTTLTK